MGSAKISTGLINICIIDYRIKLKKSQLLPSCSPKQTPSLNLSLRLELIVLEAMSDRRFGSSAEKLPDFNDAPSRGEALDHSRSRAASEMMLATRPRRYELKAFCHPWKQKITCWHFCKWSWVNQSRLAFIPALSLTRPWRWSQH